MKEKVINLIGDSLKESNVYVDDAFIEREASNKFLRVVIDSENMIDIDKCVEVTKIIDPILEKSDLIKEYDILDVYAKSKGDE